MTRTEGPPQSLGKVAARGGAILGVATATEQGAQFLRAIILARLLSPHDFGVMGMALVVVFTAEALSQTGLNRAIVQKRGDPSEDLSTVWILSSLRGVTLYAIAWVIAPLVAAGFETPEVTSILRWTALAFPIQALVNPAYFTLEREMAFVRIAWPRLVGVCCDLVVAVAASLVLRNAWGMVWGFLSGKAVWLVSSYVVRPWKPDLRLRWDRALELYRYGRHVFRASVVDCIVGQGDRALIGRLTGADSLGFYSLAARLASLPSMAGAHIVFRVAFPVFSKVQEDPIRLRKGFHRTLGLFSTLIVPVSAGLWATAEDLIPALFGARWAGMIPPFRVLCIAGACVAFYQLLRIILSAIGRPDVAARGSYLYLLVFAAPLYPAILIWGGVGAAWCTLVAGTLAMGYLFLASQRIIGMTVRGAIGSVIPSLAGGALMVAVVVSGRAALGFSASVPWLAAEIVTGAAIYISSVSLLDRLFGAQLAATILPILRSDGWRATRAAGPANAGDGEDAAAGPPGSDPGVARNAP